jgi:hypothetical protein
VETGRKRINWLGDSLDGTAAVRILRRPHDRHAWRDFSDGRAGDIFGPRPYWGRDFYLLDTGGVIATAAMLGMAIAAALGHTRRLYNEERLP